MVERLNTVIGHGATRRVADTGNDMQLRFAPSLLHVGNQLIGRIGAQIDGGIAGVRCTASAAALIKEHNAIHRGIERSPHPRYTAGPGPAMHRECGSPYRPLLVNLRGGMPLAAVVNNK